MSYIKNSSLELIGETPILKLNQYAKELDTNVFAKLESFNLSGSVKDRIALAMIKDAQKKEYCSREGQSLNRQVVILVLLWQPLRLLKVIRQYSHYLKQ